MTGAPTGLQVDIEFTAGTWTNVTTYFDNTVGFSIKYGRTNPAGTPQVATLSLQFDNDGRFTPFNGASPYYPNLPFTTPGMARKRIRVSYGSGASPVYVGYIKEWLPRYDNGGPRSYVQVNAVDRMDPLSRRTFLTNAQEATRALVPLAYFPLSDAANTTTLT